MKKNKKIFGQYTVMIAAPCLFFIIYYNFIFLFDYSIYFNLEISLLVNWLIITIGTIMLLCFFFFKLKNKTLYNVREKIYLEILFFSPIIFIVMNQSFYLFTLISLEFIASTYLFLRIQFEKSDYQKYVIPRIRNEKKDILLKISKFNDYREISFFDNHIMKKVDKIVSKNFYLVVLLFLTTITTVLFYVLLSSYLIINDELTLSTSLSMFVFTLITPYIFFPTINFDESQDVEGTSERKKINGLFYALSIVSNEGQNILYAKNPSYHIINQNQELKKSLRYLVNENYFDSFLFLDKWNEPIAKEIDWIVIEDGPNLISGVSIKINVTLGKDIDSNYFERISSKIRLEETLSKYSYNYDTLIGEEDKDKFDLRDKILLLRYILFEKDLMIIKHELSIDESIISDVFLHSYGVKLLFK